MPIELLDEKSVEQRCINCGTARTLEFNRLELTVEPNARAEASAAKINLPVCDHPGCCSSETLFVSPRMPRVSAVPGSYGHLHSLLVDKLAAQLIQLGRVGGAESAAEEHVAKPREEELRSFFAERLVLPLTTPLNPA